MARTRRPSPALVFSVTTAVLLLLVLGHQVRHRPVGRWEQDLFALLNHLPPGATPALVVVMQLGSYPAVVGAASVALVMRRVALARDLLLAGTLAYGLAVVNKIAVARARPGALLADVRLHETVTGAFGYPSGHVAVVTALALVVARVVPRHMRGYLWLVVAVVALARVHVGAHLPVDAVGGFLVGWLAVGLTRLVVGEVGPEQAVARIRRTLRRRGIHVARLTPIAGDARGSRPYRATTTDGRRLFVKVTGGEQRDADRLYKLYRRVRYRHVQDEPPYVTVKQKNEHEAYLSLLAERAGVRTPGLVITATEPDGTALLVQGFVDGRPLDDPRPLPPGAVTDVCRQVARLHRAGIAHRDLRGANILRDGDTAHLVDLGFGTDDATADQRARDVVELLVTLAGRADAPEVVAAAVDQFGPEPVADCLPYLQPPSLSRAGRRILDDRPGLLDQLRDEILRRCPHRSDRLARVVRITPRGVFLLVMLGLLVHFLLPQLGQVRTALRLMLHAGPLAVSGALLASAATYLLGALALRLAAVDRVPLGRTVLLQVAASFANRLAPGSVGGAALSLRYLHQQGLSTAEAATAVAVSRLAGVGSVLVLLPVLLPFARRPSRELVHLAATRGLVVLLAVLAVLLVAAAVLALPRLRARGRAATRQAVDALRALVHHGRLVRLLAVCLALTLAYGASLYLALLAVGLPDPLAFLPAVLLVCIVGEGVASAAPTPGGLGATEAALVSGLLLSGVPVETAVAGVLVYRLATFWLPAVPGYLALRVLVHRRLV
ncbi:flippase-like domain-containing protein [Micromonospora cathayae]|uniref:Flippase-like domain-containing protein n=1 Tax=Micromonospora cathayae TaxID=3028804 RepID=A0ABY7ZKA5_9ACTN|nr:flippase-like domain-containing protein [Micromonospora sp. HUAS 3]WDZ83391.1 flippase-like domain-containing protein [Micromonospora sp. HUAS 3]